MKNGFATKPALSRKIITDSQWCDGKKQRRFFREYSLGVCVSLDLESSSSCSLPFQHTKRNERKIGYNVFYINGHYSFFSSWRKCEKKTYFLFQKKNCVFAVLPLFCFQFLHDSWLSLQLFFGWFIFLLYFLNWKFSRKKKISSQPILMGIFLFPGFSVFFAASHLGLKSHAKLNLIFNYFRCCCCCCFEWLDSEGIFKTTKPNQEFYN